MIHQTSVLVLLICLGIFVVVGGLLLYAVVRYRQRPTDDDTPEPPQVYGSTAIELAWTVPPILIVVVLALVAMCVCVTAVAGGGTNCLATPAAVRSTSCTSWLPSLGVRLP